MSDAGRDFGDLRREIVEARNQAIKTDNQVKNLSLDVKGFEKRFDSLERRTRVASLGVHLIVALTIIGATYMVHSVRVRSLTADLEKSINDAQAQKDVAEKTAGEARGRLATSEQERSRRDKAASIATKLVENLDQKREKEAVDLIESLDLSVLTPLEAKLLEKRIGDLRVSAAETSYKSAKSAMDQKRSDVAVRELRRALSLDPEGRYADASRYLLATQLWAQKRYDEAEPAFRDILKHESDKPVLEEVRYLLAGTLASMGRRDDAKALFNEIVQRGGRYGSSAKDQLKALESSGQLAESAPPAPSAKPVAPAPSAPPAKPALPPVAPAVRKPTTPAVAPAVARP